MSERAAPFAPCLLVDTSIQGVGIGVVDLAAPPRVGAPAALLFEALHPDNMGSVVAIAGLVRQGLQTLGLTPADLAAVAVAVGPGTFTGIKVGLAFAYGLRAGSAQPLPLLGLSAIEEAAALTRDEGGAATCLLALPATRTHGFVGCAAAEGQRSWLLDVESADGAGVDALLAGLPAAGPAGILRIVGSWPLLADALARRGRTVPSATAPEICRTAMRGMARAAVAAWPQGFGETLPEPRYLRLSTAEERLLQLKAEQAP